MSIENIGQLAIDLQAMIDARNQAKRTRLTLLKAYSHETGEWYLDDDNDEPDPKIDAAHAEYKAAQKALTAVRSKLRSAIRKHTKAMEPA